MISLCPGQKNPFKHDIFWTLSAAPLLVGSIVCLSIALHHFVQLSNNSGVKWTVIPLVSACLSILFSPIHFYYLSRKRRPGIIFCPLFAGDFLIGAYAIISAALPLAYRSHISHPRTCNEIPVSQECLEWLRVYRLITAGCALLVTAG